MAQRECTESNSKEDTARWSTPRPAVWVRAVAARSVVILMAVALLAVTVLVTTAPAHAQLGEIYDRLTAYGYHDGGGFDTRTGGFGRWEWTPGTQRLETSTAHPTIALGEKANSYARVYTAIAPTEPSTHLNFDVDWSGFLRSGGAEGQNLASANVRIFVRVYEISPNGGPFGLAIPVGFDHLNVTLVNRTTFSGPGFRIADSAVETHELSRPLVPGKNYRVELSVECSTTTTIAILVDSATCDFQFTPYTPFLGSPVPDNGYGVYLNRWYFENRSPLGPQCDGLDPTVLIAEGDMPTEGNDVIVGTPGDDIIDGLGGNDTICGLGGDDEIRGSDGDDTILGHEGNDKLFGGKGADRILGGTGADILHGNRGADFLYGEDGDDRIYGYSEDDYIDGGSGNDRLHGNRGNDTILGGPDDDAIFGYADDDQLLGGSGDDLVGGNFGNDLILGEIGNDRLYGSDGMDQVDGGDGDDVVEGNSGDDEISGGSGDDLLDGGINNDSCDGGDGIDEATRCETITAVP